MGHPQVRWSMSLVTQDERIAAQLQGDREGIDALPLKSMECGKCRSQRERALEHRSIRASADVPNCRAATPTAFHRAWPSRVRGSSTRLAPNSGVESRAARSCLAPKPPVFSANATVHSSRVLARLWAMSRMRKCSKVPWRKGGCAAPRQSTTICQRLSILGTLVHREEAPTRPHCSGKSSCLIHEETWEDSAALYGTTHIPPNLVVRSLRRALIPSRGQDLQVEHPVGCG